MKKARSADLSKCRGNYWYSQIPECDPNRYRDKRRPQKKRTRLNTYKSLCEPVR